MCLLMGRTFSMVDMVRSPFAHENRRCKMALRPRIVQSLEFDAEYAIEER